MKNRTFLLLIGLMLVFAVLACNTINVNLVGETVRGAGTVIEEGREIGNISGVELATVGTLHITSGTGESLRIEAEDNLLDYIQTNVRAGKLVIETREGINLRPTKPINYDLTVDRLNSIEISSSGDVEAGSLQSGSFSIDINSSGNLSLSSLDCTSLKVDISSSGNVAVDDLKADSISVKVSSSGNLEILGGQVQQQSITISSSGEYRARDLASAEAEANLSSSGTATIRVSERLSGRLTSSGDIRYIGDPEVNVSTTSSGKAVQINE